MPRSSRSDTVTRDDVARAAGVSTAVVSYVINDGPRKVSDQARERVLHAIQELGYRRNAAARALMTGSSGIYGMVIPEARNPHFALAAHFAVEEAARAGVELMLLHEVGMVRSMFERVAKLPAGQVDGLLVAGVFKAADAPRIKALGYRTVLLNQLEEIPGLASFGVDLRDAAVMGVEHLLSHGYDEIGFVGGVNPKDGRADGWQATTVAGGAKLGPDVKAGFSARGAYEAARGLLAGKRPPRALFVASDQQAWGVLRALAEAGYSVPDDVAIVAFDGTDEGAYMLPGLTSVAPPTEQIIHDAFAELRSDPAPEPRHHPYELELVVRRSCGCTPPAPKGRTS